MAQVPHRIPFERLKADDPRLIVVTAHLHLESVVVAFIDNSMPRPEALLLDRLSFPVKVSLAVALGYFPEHASKPLLRINAIRNRLAHHLDSEITESDAEALRTEAAFLSDLIDIPEWSSFSPMVRVAHICSILQTYLFGMLDAFLHPGEATSPEWVKARAAELYPAPPAREREERRG